MFLNNLYGSNDSFRIFQWKDTFPEDKEGGVVRPIPNYGKPHH